MKNFTHSFRLLTLLAALFVMSASAMAQVATDLIISEYLEGSGNNKALEIYNGTGADVDLSNYSLQKEVNGAGGFKGELKLTGTLANGKTYVLVNSGSNIADLKAKADKVEASITSFNGNDAVGLFKNGSLIDVVGVVGNTANWGMDVTLRRKSSILSPNAAYVVDEWDIAAKDDISNIGMHSLSAVVGASVTFGTSGDLGSIETGTTVNKTIIVKGADLTGDVTVAISGTGFSSTKTTLPKSELESEAGCELPVKFVASATGTQEGTVTITGGGLTEAKTLTLSANVYEVAEVSTLAAVLANPKGETVYKLTSEATIIFINKANIYLHDATATTLLYNGSKIIPDADIAVGHNLKGIKVKVDEYNGAKQLVPVAMGTIPSQGNVVPEPEVTTVEALVANPGNFAHKLVVVHNVTMENKAFGTPPTNNTVTGVSGTATLVCRDNFGVLEGFTPPATQISLIGFVELYSNKAQIYPRSTGDISTFVSNPSLDATNTKVYATAGRVIVETESAARVEIFNTVGQAVKVVTVDGSATINLNKGLYIVRVNGKAVKVLVR